MNDKVSRFPVSGVQRRRNRLGKRGVHCLVSDRWLQFPENSTELSDGTYMFVDVMTTSSDGEITRKLCSLCISKEDLVVALKAVG